MRDFTELIFAKLLEAFIDNNYSIIPFKDFINTKDKKVITLRHDIDNKPLNALKIAKIEHSFDIKATYFFRADKKVLDEDIIKKIIELGHEIGYQYETLTTANGDYEQAIKIFEDNLNSFRKLYPVKTICMDGQPRYKWDNRDLWKKYDYHKYDIIAEPYLDINFTEVAYYTDTGRMWDGQKYSIRDKVADHSWPKYHSTFDIINAIEKEKFPLKAMLNIHTQRWDNSIMEWYKELVLQSIKNVIKKYYVKKQNV